MGEAKAMTPAEAFKLLRGAVVGAGPSMIHASPSVVAEWERLGLMGDDVNPLP